MASILSVGVPKVGFAGCLIRLCKTSKNHNAIQVAFIKRLAFQDPINKPAPYPYWKKPYTEFRLMDPMTFRYDENTKLLVVDGLPAVGKSKLCEKLADELGMLYMPQPMQDDYYINMYGFDVRELDSQLPFYCQSCDLTKFLKNPNDKRVARFQLIYLYMRFEQYLNALLHILSTGQGVILNRSFYSDDIFVEAMRKAGYIGGPALKIYKDINFLMSTYLLNPHVIIYLDVPVELVKDKIKQRGNPDEVNSKVFTTEYLTDIENVYKHKYLKERSERSHLLIYDWSKGDDYETVIEDLESLDVDNYEDGKQEDWIFYNTNHLRNTRALYDLWNRNELFLYLYCTELSVHIWPRELMVTYEENVIRKKVLRKHPIFAYREGYNPKAGDKVLWKIQEVPYSIRGSSRDFINRGKYMS